MFSVSSQSSIHDDPGALVTYYAAIARLRRAQAELAEAKTAAADAHKRAFRDRQMNPLPWELGAG